MHTQSEVNYIKRCAQLAQRAMTRRKYDLAHRLVNKVPSAIGVKMKLLIIEHEVGYRRSMGEVI